MPTRGRRYRIGEVLARGELDSFHIVANTLGADSFCLRNVTRITYYCTGVDELPPVSGYGVGHAQ